jgi:ribonuclease P protein component
MLSRPHRLTKKKEIERVFQRGRSFFTAILGVKAAPAGRAVTRFAVVVSIKVAKKATARNRIKRQLRAILRENRTQVSPGYDVVLVARSGIEKSSREALVRAVELAFRKLGLTKGFSS